VRLLLDTCSLLWALHAPRKLRPAALRAMEDSQNSIHVSPLSFWEISLKSSLGKLEIHGASPEEIAKMVIESGWHIAPFLAETAATFHLLPRIPQHKDPFDRMLVWMAIRENFVFVSRDGHLGEYIPFGLKICAGSE
jgi:PIN domain nuclease of toxin-antitoxin system